MDERNDYDSIPMQDTLTLDLESYAEANTIQFYVSGTPEPIMKIKQGTFYWKGEAIEDKYEIYERFNDWLKQVEK